MNKWQIKMKAECNRRYYEKRKQLHKCVDCGEQDERTLSGRIRCRACVEKEKHRQMTRCTAKTKRKENARKENTRKLSKPKLSIYEIVHLAIAEGLSYGQYVAKHRYDNRISGEKEIK